MVLGYAVGLVALLLLGKVLFDGRHQKRPLRIVWVAPLGAGLILMIVGTLLRSYSLRQLTAEGAGILLFLGGMIAYVAVPQAKR